MDYAQQGVQAFQQFSNLIQPNAGNQSSGGNQPSAPAGQQSAGTEPNAPVGEPSAVAPQADAPQAPAALGQAQQQSFAPQQQSFAQIANLLQALQLGQIPGLPGQAPQAPAPVAAPRPAAPQLDATGMLRLLLGNPQLHQALQLATVLGSAGSRNVELPLPAAPPPAAAAPRARPAPRTPSMMQIPLGAVMNAIAALAGQSMAELNASTREDDPEVPEYLVSETGEFIVDPTNAAERAALVTHYFRLSGEAMRSGLFGGAQKAKVLDESDLWARDAGLDR
jgi:hypothetical protein